MFQPPVGSCNADVPTKQKTNGLLYNALVTCNRKDVVDRCQRISDHALHVITVNDDTVLHMATYAKEAALVERLLDELPDHHVDKLTRQNRVGNTILHETATSNHAIAIADKLLKRAPGLLGMRNHNGETALFRAARYGKTDMFNFLAAKVSRYDEEGLQFYVQRSDKTTILHIAILSEHFDLAYRIALDYTHLIGQKDADGMTGLQLLSCNPSAFKLETEEGFINLAKSYGSSVWREKVQKQKQLHRSAVELAKFLVRKDTSWEFTYSSIDQSKPKIHKYGEKGGKERQEVHLSNKILDKEESLGETPLILATKSGCVEIVEEILKLYPQAVEHIDDGGRNVLHVAIKYRQRKIFELVKGMDVPMRRLARKTDSDGNSILHTVGRKRKDFVSDEKMEGPAFLLQEELLWFERVKEVTPSHFLNHQNNMKLTAEGYFITANSELRNLAKEWLKTTAEGCSVVAVLIATVAFAAAYTVPGGPNQSTGVPVLVNKPFFVVFTVTDVLSLTFALTSVVTFLSILTSPFRFKDFKHTLPNKLLVGFTFLFLSVAMMMVAFGATIILMIYSKESWTKITLYAVSFIPVGIFALSYFPFYPSLLKTYDLLQKIPFIKHIPAIPWNSFKCCRVETTDTHFP
ncbi:PREDICTED: ankyrin repeat-containing protein At5g02620-like isoform X4 [Populus euphratica]|uniref:Ankyrin repeat-containing protein At5g02620-like isoform X4 n=1 Tax=Populus euphratica TaxID=75702 RepID=A0AAJ6T1M0_POPEU|nr:PREDICTED: ankyrin repeat-containing protein At5g02620-like isoform X4 [Populus euphratica]